MDKTKKGVEEEETIAPESQEEEVENEDSEASAESTQQEIDYKAEVEKLQIKLGKTEEERDNYKEGLLNKKKEEKDEKKKKKDDEPEEDLIARKVQEELSKFASGFTKSTVEQVLGSLTDNPDKKELIRHHYEHSIVKSGVDPQSIREDLENALLIVDKKVLFKRQSELETSLKNRSQISGMGQGTSAAAASKGKSFFSKEQLAEFKKRNYSDEKIKRIEQAMRKQAEK